MCGLLYRRVSFTRLERRKQLPARSSETYGRDDLDAVTLEAVSLTAYTLQ
jgi:hypothetical protein